MSEKKEKTVQEILKESQYRQQLVDWYQEEGEKVWGYDKNDIGGAFWLLMAEFTKAGY
jgi:hypothetical protein